MKLLVYSHDAFGLGNIRRMLAVCQHLLGVIPNLSILVLSGSPALHSLRLPRGLDYIKLPCVSRNTKGELDVRFLGESLEVTMRLRSQLIRAAIANFQPDLFLVDKKPTGLEGELEPALADLKANHSQCKLVLLLRDILDAPQATIPAWRKKGYYRIIREWYDQIWVVGSPHLFDLRQEYQFPPTIARKVRFCGYVRRGIGKIPRREVRSQLGFDPKEPMALVTAGGGGDGKRLLQAYLAGLAGETPLGQHPTLQHAIVCGPEMPAATRQLVAQAAGDRPRVRVLEFTPDLDSYMNAADVVVSMGGYNTICEILSLQKRAVVVPRHRPVQEQFIRAQRLGALGAFAWIHPEALTPTALSQTVLEQLEGPPPQTRGIDLDALPRLAWYLRRLLAQSAPRSPNQAAAVFSHSAICIPTVATSISHA